MRCFVAIPIPAQILVAVRACQDALRQIPSGVRWVRLDSQHLTVKFLGDIEEGQRQMIQDVLEGVVGEVPPIPITLRELGVFPSLGSPRVFWVGVHEPQGHLHRLAIRVENSLSRLGIRRDSRSWHPHVTLGRVKKSFGLKQVTDYITIRAQSYEAGCFVARGMTLFESNLKPGGPEYRPLASFEFSAAETHGDS